MPFKVKAECVDARSGKRYFPGDTFDPAPDPDQAERLIKAGCIFEGGVPTAIPSAAVKAGGAAHVSAIADQGQRTEAGEAEQRAEEAAASDRLAAEAQAEEATARPAAPAAAKPRAKK